ncbi:DUF6883 domain-containing protein [Okeania sp. SIO1I7]|uniref:DUF6883 domain-containing protein n=1 Tax=Okeania sp. SIO1I7 TaxID=2607772 RepID=UPI0013F9929A|nr:DUF6883 domain-containing protein [Okeania sp. SIO1I7]NET24777.1 hypothetical protein [Okeania sp. SIO1I7]
MKIPNQSQAIIEQSKITEYLLNIQHLKGGHKARLLIKFGYNINNWQQLEADIRENHLNADPEIVKETAYGISYEISAEILTPSGKLLNLKTVLQIDKGKEIPRLITAYPN